jgi:hypothetical protein
LEVLKNDSLNSIAVSTHREEASPFKKMDETSSPGKKR